MMRRLALAALAATLSACLLFTSLDDTTGGAEPSPDGGTGDAEGGSPDASSAVDGNTNDVTPPVDGGRFCSGDAGFFCADFDDPPIDKGWTGLSTGVGTLSLDKNALVADVPITTDYQAGSFLFEKMNKTFSVLSCSFDFGRDVIGEHQTSFIELHVATADQLYDAILYTAPVEGRLLVYTYPGDGGNGDATQTNAAVAFPAGESHRITLEVNGTQARAFVDGQLTASLPHNVPLTPIQTTLRFGEPQIDGANATAWKLRMDNLRCDLTP